MSPLVCETSAMSLDSFGLRSATVLHRIERYMTILPLIHLYV